MKKKILFLLSTLNGGGAEKVLIDILRNLDGEKYDITVCTLFNEGVYIKELPEYVTHRYVFRRRIGVVYSVFWRMLKYLPRRWMYKLFIRGKYDVEVAFLEGLATMLLSGSDCPNRIAWLHTDIVNHDDYIAPYHRSDEHILENYRQYDKVVFVSEQGRSQFEKRFGPLETGRVIYNLIDKKVIEDRSREFIPGEDPGVPVVCTVGRFIPVKGYMRLLEVHKKLIGEGIAHKLWFLGIGDEEEKMKAFVAENGLSDSVTFWGFQRNPYPYVNRAELYVCSSHAEGYPLSVCEALVLHKPIVATNCTGPTEILRNGDFGLLVENSEEGIYEGLKSLLTDPVRMEDVRSRAVLGAEQIDPARIVKQIEDLF